MKSDKYYMEVAYKEAEKAYEKNEIPVGAVIVCDGKIISKAHNLRDSSGIVTKHAEIIAIERANKKKKNWRLNDCILYSTLEPCHMCISVIESCKLAKVIYAATSNETINFRSRKVMKNQIADEEIINKSSKLIQNAFINIREKKINYSKI